MPVKGPIRGESFLGDVRNNDDGSHSLVYIVTGALTAGAAIDEVESMRPVTSPDNVNQFARPAEVIKQFRSDGWKIRVPYETLNTSWGPGARPDLPNGQKVISIAFDSALIQMPIIFIQRVLDDSTDRVTLVYSERESSFPIVELVLNVDMALNNWSLTDTNTVANQVNKIHNFASRDWLFQGGNVVINGQSSRSIRYRWVSRPAIPGRDGNGEKIDPGGMVPSPDLDNDKFVILPPLDPFERWLVERPDATVDAMGVVDQPAWTALVQSTFEDGSASVLPGNPLDL